MKAWMIVKEENPQKKKLLEGMLRSFNDNHWEFSIMAETEGGAIQGEELPLIRRLLDETALMGEKEYGVLIPENLCGPVLPLHDFEQRIQQTEAPFLQAARTSGIAVFQAGALKDSPLIQWILGGMKPEELDSFAGDELYDTKEIRKRTDVPLLDEPGTMIQEIGFPFFSLEVFKRPFGETIQTTLGDQARTLLQTLRALHFDDRLLLKYLTAVCNQQDLMYTLQLFFVLSSRQADKREGIISKGKKQIALGMHLYYEDLIPQSREYAERFPPETDVIITTSDEEKKKRIESAFSEVRCNSLDVRVIGNRGRDVSSLLIGMKDIADWKYVCFYHDKKTLQTKPGSIGQSFAYQCAENLFSSREYIMNIIQLFEQEESLGLLTPPPPNHSDYYFTMALPWGPNWEVSYALYQKLQLTVPISRERAPVAPLGTCFWFRGAALKTLLEKDWKYEDFPPEPNRTDGTILHAFERIYPFCAQNEGYIPAYICSDRFAAVLRTTLLHYTKSYNQVSFENGILSKVEDMQQRISERIQ